MHMSNRPIVFVRSFNRKDFTVVKLRTTTKGVPLHVEQENIQASEMCFRSRIANSISVTISRLGFLSSRKVCRLIYTSNTAAVNVSHLPALSLPYSAYVSSLTLPCK